MTWRPETWEKAKAEEFALPQRQLISPHDYEAGADAMLYAIATEIKKLPNKQTITTMLENGNVGFEECRAAILEKILPSK